MPLHHPEYPETPVPPILNTQNTLPRPPPYPPPPPPPAPPPPKKKKDDSYNNNNNNTISNDNISECMCLETPIPQIVKPQYHPPPPFPLDSFFCVPPSAQDLNPEDPQISPKFGSFILSLYHLLKLSSPYFIDSRVVQYTLR